MQFKTNLRLALFSLILGGLLPISQLQAQVIRDNEKGEKIIVYEDGSWQYFSDYSSGSTEVYQAEDKITRNRKYPVFTGEIEPLDGNIDVTQEDLYNIASRRAQLAKEAVHIAQERADKAKQAREQIQEEFLRAQRSGNSNEQDLKHLTTRLKAAKNMELETAREALLAEQEAEKAEELTVKGGFVEAFNLKQKRKRNQSKAIAQLPANTAVSFSIPLSDNSQAAAGQRDLLLYPPTPSCQMAFQGKDEKTGQWRRDVKKELLFTHTDDRLRPFLKDKEYLKCEGNFTSVGGYRFLALQFTFAYPNAREAYGFIEKGSYLTIKLLNGDFINLKAGKMDRGSYDLTTDLLTYQVHYPIDRSQMGLLKHSEVDTIRVFWSSGFEEYEVFQLDFFINQLSCLENF
ncbi:MAG: hypothetical protein F6K19_22355 [Cyanothece sp. SIO1E1]|nr:hypothetical protein [Cyanothece sp. SIO1E1]